jgi:hypothetical protein
VGNGRLQPGEQVELDAEQALLKKALVLAAEMVKKPEKKAFKLTRHIQNKKLLKGMGLLVNTSFTCKCFVVAGSAVRMVSQGLATIQVHYEGELINDLTAWTAMKGVVGRQNGRDGFGGTIRSMLTIQAILLLLKQLSDRLEHLGTAALAKKLKIDLFKSILAQV